MRFSLVACIAALTLPTVAFAQFNGLDTFSVGLTPQFPLPYSAVQVRPVSGSVPLSNATMLVVANGKTVYEGSAQSVSVPVGAAGELTTIKVTMTSNGKAYTKTLAAQPQDVVLVAEPAGSAPVLYPGKPLVPLEGAVRVVAVAGLYTQSGKSIDPTKLSYAWVVDDTRIADSSGIGKMAINVASPLQYQSRDVSVTVSTQDGSLVGGASLTLVAQAPTIRLYEFDPLLGLLTNRAVTDSFAITSGERTLIAAPYSFPLLGGGPQIRWSLNSSPAKQGPSITLRPTGSGQGTASLSATVTAGDTTTDSAQLSVSFGKTPSGLGIFGL